jgi:mevalonate kinase
MKVLAPGKLILSGEHAVVYGHPALAMAVNRYVTATATPQRAPLISFDFSDLDYRGRLSLTALDSLKNRIKHKYQKFVSGEFKIRDVLQKPVELAQVAFSLFFEALNIKLTQGIKIHIESSIPIGCGMGSSAATVLSVVTAIAKHLDMDLSSEMFFRLAQQAENMQHGYSSGLDLQISLHGGCIFIKEGTIFPRSLPQVPMYLVNTGVPKTNTGECVEAAANHFKTTNIGDDFAEVTMAMDAALQVNSMPGMKEAIAANHKLLVQIGVVPTKVQEFISEINQRGDAAKICGAGAVGGEQAGIALVVTEHLTELTDLCSRYHYNLLPIAGEARGVHVI